MRHHQPGSEAEDEEETEGSAPATAAARFLVTSFGSGFGHGFLYAYLIGQYAGPVLMGLALWRSRSVPRWLYMLPFAAAMILLAVRIWQAAARPAASLIRPALGVVAAHHW
jgi:hypothetical protein